jgi:hypothetical protein
MSIGSVAGPRVLDLVKARVRGRRGQEEDRKGMSDSSCDKTCGDAAGIHL